jgi:hypothetical protein
MAVETCGEQEEEEEEDGRENGDSKEHPVPGKEKGDGRSEK